MAEEKDFCTIANTVVEDKIEDINREIESKESEIYDYIDSKTKSKKDIYNIVTINPNYVDDFIIKTSKAKITNNIVYFYVQIEFLRDFNTKAFVLGNVDSEKIALPYVTAFIGSTITIGQINTAGEVDAYCLRDGSYTTGTKVAFFGSYITG